MPGAPSRTGYANFTLSSCEAEMLRLEGDTFNFKEPGTCWVKRCFPSVVCDWCGADSVALFTPKHGDPI